MPNTSPTRTARALRHGILALFAAALLLQAPLVARAADEVSKDSRDNFLKTNAKFLEAFRQPVAKPANSTVRILTDGKEVALGTIVGPNGWILTKASEISSRPVVHFKDGKEMMAIIVGVEPHYDLAMLKVDAKGLPAVELTESKVAPVGNWVASVGQGETPVTVGVVSVASRTLPPREVTRPTVLANSGFLGVGLDAAKEGPKIASVQKGSAADKAGLVVNDVILSVDGHKMEDPDSVINTLSHTKPGDVVVVKVQRGDEQLEFKPKLEKRPADRGDYQNHLGSELSNRRTGFPTFLQHDAVLKPQDCGGPLVDLDGKVIGVNIARAGRVESYAIPSEAILALMPDLMSGKLPPNAETLKPLTPEEMLAQAKSELQKAEEEKKALDSKMAELKDAVKKAQLAAKEHALTAAMETVDKAEEEKIRAEERVSEIRRAVVQALEQGQKINKAVREEAEEELAAAKKRLADARAALKKVQEEQAKLEK